MHPALSLQTHYDTKPFMMIPDVGTECNTRRAKSVTAYHLIQAQRASVCHLASARYIFCCCCRFLFPPVLQRGQLWHWDRGLRHQKTEMPRVQCSLWMISAHAAWLKRSP